MLIRALVVLLLVLNLGVALWWALRPSVATQVQVPAEPAAGVATLQLASETRPDRPSAPVPPKLATAVSQCVGFGPYDAPEAAAKARSTLQPLAVEVRLRREYAGTPRNWKVFLPPFETIAQAEATADRIAAAGFKDYFVVRDGADARSLALGLYGNQKSARERVATLLASGFEADVVPIGAGPALHWVDVAAGAGFDAAAAKVRVAAEQAEPIDCEGFAPVEVAAAR